LECNCIMTNLIHKFLIYLYIYFCLTCFGLSFSTFSEAGYNFGSGSSLLGMVSAPRKIHLSVTFTSKLFSGYNLCVVQYQLFLRIWLPDDGFVEEAETFNIN
jgi:hypothetical protein